eukprot:TRINITY_DN1411_c0_g1_i1.p1 TRINITY_DN1411_c0_g1~~TRINITY_DN1411_c0_g1_i1.p1  ORF type:complete len:179 (-),score=33.81 TRINITY_DN1411_c0_g1_i1:61-597(-)
MTAYFQLPNFHCQELDAFLVTLKRAGITISLDPQYDASGLFTGKNGHLKQILPLFDFFFPNETEATKISGEDTPEEALELFCKLLPETLVVVKCGAKGSIAGKGSEHRWKKEVPCIPLVDTTGAGDAFVAGFLISHVLHKNDVEKSLNYASAVASLTISHLGGPANYLWTDEELVKFL